MEENNQMKDMQDRTPVKSITVSGGATHKLFIVKCEVCQLILAQTEVPMSEEGIRNKIRSHNCVNPNKQDFEKELR